MATQPATYRDVPQRRTRKADREAAVSALIMWTRENAPGGFDSAKAHDQSYNCSFGLRFLAQNHPEAHDAIVRLLVDADDATLGFVRDVLNDDRLMRAPFLAPLPDALEQWIEY